LFLVAKGENGTQREHSFPAFPVCPPGVPSSVAVATIFPTAKRENEGQFLLFLMRWIMRPC
jgi:hypothetical protein